MTIGKTRLRLSGVFLIGLGACGSNPPDGSSAICAPGQVSGCHCADGQLPATTGCSKASGSSTAGSDAGATTPPSAQADAGAVDAGNIVVVQEAGAEGGQTPATGLADAGGGGPAADAGGGDASAGNDGSAADTGADGSADAFAGDGMASLQNCGANPTVGVDKKSAPGPSGTGRHPTGSVDFKAMAGNRFLRLQTTLEVPATPNGNSTLFEWPGLEPIQGVSMNFDPIGRGVLQPVLTWGSSCAPGSAATADHYWISGMYVNISAQDPSFQGCFGGDVMNVAVGDKLYIDIRLEPGTTTWSQSVTDLANNKTVTFDMDLKGQDQNWALFEIEVSTSTLPSSDVIFTDSVLTLANSEPAACQPDSFGPNDYFTAPLASKDGVTCCIERIVLREQGVPATTTDP